MKSKIDRVYNKYISKVQSDVNQACLSEKQEQSNSNYVDDKEWVKNKIEEAIRRFEPRVELLDVVVTSVPERNSFTVSIVFRPVNVRNTATVTLSLERTR